MRCDLRTEHACDCTTGQCKASKPVEAPVAAPERCDFLVMFAFAAVMAGIAFGTLYQVNQQGVQIQIAARV